MGFVFFCSVNTAISYVNQYRQSIYLRNGLSGQEYQHRIGWTLHLLPEWGADGTYLTVQCTLYLCLGVVSTVDRVVDRCIVPRKCLNSWYVSKAMFSE